ncbi:MAG: hypothetical protein WAT79_08725 [Saprospiraceae bacterium]
MKDVKIIRLLGYLETVVKIGNTLEVNENCFCEYYLNELTSHWRPGLKEKKLNKGNLVEVVGFTENLYGDFIKVKFEGETYEIKPYYLKQAPKVPV